MLTDMQCRKAAAKDKPYKLGDGHGLFLQVMPTGSKLWRLKYRYEGKEKLLSLGPYPLVPLIEARKQLIDGIDPAVAKKEKSREEQLKAETTFMHVAREWHELYKERWSAGHAATVLHRMENDIFPDLGARPIGEITASELLSVIRKIEDRGAHEMARRATQICGQVFRSLHLIRQIYCLHHPAQLLRKGKRLSNN